MSGVVRMDQPTVHYRGCLWTGPIGRMVIFLAMISLLIPLFIGPGSRASASGGHDGTYFEYDYDQDISKCKGEYSGYDEKTRGTGRYEVIEWGPDSAKVKYSWRASYSNNDGDDRDDNRKGTLEFDLTDRRYLTSEFDLDDPEYRGIPAQEMAVWFYIPPNVEEGNRIHILDSEWRVTDTDKTLWSRWVPRKVIEVTHSSSSSRNDEYGVFDYHFTDRLYFDKETGFFFAERYDEWDHGYYLGAHASFKLTIDLDVTSSSYHIQINWLPFLSVYVGSALAVAGTFWSLCQLWKRFRWRKRERTIKGVDPNSPSQPITVRIYRIRDILDLPQLKNNATTYFEPFLEHWTRKALLMGDPVVAAVSSNTGLVGFGMYNREGSIGTILCRNTQLTEEIRSFLRCKDFFTETRHMIDVTNEMRESPEIMNLIAQSRGETYNLFETNTVYRLPQLYPCKYDSDLVRPMKESDLREVA
ncbi:MAG: hypothetical protein MUC62_09430, partial [Candidatus Thermoplasmatota archaeon]|nr:hypothetical protein [Candidatus Thermoplasmatota archaeon]